MGARSVPSSLSEPASPSPAHPGHGEELDSVSLGVALVYFRQERCLKCTLGDPHVTAGEAEHGQEEGPAHLSGVTERALASFPQVALVALNSLTAVVPRG